MPEASEGRLTRIQLTHGSNGMVCNVPIKRALGAAAILILTVSMRAALAASPPIEDVRKALARHSPDLVAEHLSASPAAGLFHVVLGGTSGYVTQDGRFFIPGDLLDIQARKNLTEDVRRSERVELLQSVRPDEQIVFAAKRPKYAVTVFTDVDCGYCRKLHSEIATLNDLGITVKYVAFPRSGPGTESWSKMEGVWCSADRNAVLTRAKLGETIVKPAKCAPEAVARDFKLGEQIGVQGTPTIVLQNGSVIGGYVSPAELKQQLDQQTAGG